MKKFFIFLIIWTLFGCIARAENFSIEEYNVEIVVDKNKSAQITETLDVYFEIPSHGIYRDIPYKNAIIKDVRVSEQFDTSDWGTYFFIKIGNPNFYVDKFHKYRIQYKYNYHDNKNEFYHNLIGTGWDTNIYRAHFKIVFPEAIDAKNVTFYCGEYGNTESNGCLQNIVIRDNIILAENLRVLKPHEGITILVNLPENYFNKYINYPRYFTFAGLFILTFLSLLLWYKEGRDEPVTPIVNFYAPEKLNALEAELAYKGQCTKKGIVALLIELAQKGYFEIIEEGKSWKLVQIRNYERGKRAEKRLLNSLFKKKSKTITEEQLYKSKSFCIACVDILKDKNKMRSELFYEKTISPSLTLRMLFYLICILVLTMFAFSEYNASLLFYIKIMLSVFPLIAIFVILNFKYFSATLWGLCFGGIPTIMLINEILKSNTINDGIIGIVCFIIAGICTYHIPKRTPYGHALLNQLAGLKKFIKVAEKSKLKMLVEEDPKYFYNILPYAYVLGVSNKWIKKFEKIIQDNPDWYSGGRFSTHSFNSLSHSVGQASIPTSANGGIYYSSDGKSIGGGGGHSGGGGGGGGGGSW